MNKEDFSNIFIVGSPRSGTSALSMALGIHPLLWTPSETDVFVYLFQHPWFHEQYQRVTANPEHKNFFIDQKVSYTEFASYIGAGLDLLFRNRSGNKIWVDATPANTVVAMELMVFFPKAKFIHIIRDGRAVVNSMIQSGFSGLQFDDFKVACQFWVDYVLQGLRLTKAYPDRVLEIRNENLVLHTEREFEITYDFLGLEYCAESAVFMKRSRVNSSYLNVTKDDIKKDKDPSLLPEAPWRMWGSEERKIFIAIAGDLMTQLGYPLDFD